LGFFHQTGYEKPLLHCYKEESCKEENADDGNNDILLGELTGEETDKNVRDSAYCDTVGDRVCKRHHNECEECGNCGCDIVHINLGEVLKHKNANVDKCGCGCTCGNDSCKRSEEQAYEEADGGYERSKTGSAACCYACCGFNKGGTGGGSEYRACAGCDRVASHSLVYVDRVAIFIKHICLGSGTVKGSDSIEHIDQSKGDNKNDSVYNSTCTAGEDGVALERADDTDLAEILEGLADLTKVKGRKSPGGEIVKNGNNTDGDDYGALNLFLIKNSDKEQTEKSENNGAITFQASIAVITLVAS